MLGAYATAATLGLLLGLRYRVAAAIAASGCAVIAGTAIAILAAGWPFWSALFAGFGAACALQCGYLAGLLLVHGVTRLRPRTRD